MFSNLITLVITASALVTAANKNCVSETKYTLGMFIGDATAPLHAIDQGPAGDVLLVADRELTYPGTPFFESGGASGTTEVNLDVLGLHLTSQVGVFHLSVPDMGERYGTAAPVVGSKGTTWPHWYTTEQMVWPQQTSGAQVFFACDVEINDHKYVALSWGLAGSDGSMPQGCQGTILGKAYDVPC